ncbi:MAG: hypothetical protein MRY74_14345 [Neomegalonema sp.]|nr:hypothetical protein [Neomegalonema sp.]
MSIAPIFLPIHIFADLLNRSEANTTAQFAARLKLRRQRAVNIANAKKKLRLGDAIACTAADERIKGALLTTSSARSFTSAGQVGLPWRRSSLKPGEENAQDEDQVGR